MLLHDGLHEFSEAVAPHFTACQLDRDSSHEVVVFSGGGEKLIDHAQPFRRLAELDDGLTFKASRCKKPQSGHVVTICHGIDAEVDEQRGRALAIRRVDVCVGALDPLIITNVRLIVLFSGLFELGIILMVFSPT